jgi:hypothetical protein
MGVLWCEALMPTARAVALQGLIEEQTGQPCPCKQGHACPLMPAVAGEAVA